MSETTRYTVLRFPEPTPSEAVSSRAPAALPRDFRGRGARAGVGDKPRRLEVERARPEVSTEDWRPQDVTAAVRDPQVLAAPVMPMRLIAPTSRAAPASAGAAWGLEAIGASGRSRYDGRGVVVAVLDTGIDDTHPAFLDLSSRDALVIKDFTNEGPGDSVGHGTHCAATIFGGDVGKRIGIAPGIRKALIGKVLSTEGGSSSDLFLALQWALAQGANIISMSLGFDYPGMVTRLTADGRPVDLATSQALYAFQTNLRLMDRMMGLLRGGGGAWDALVVAAAGNESHADLPAPYRINASLPASAVDVLSVGAVAPREEDGHRIAPFSNTMPLLCAPGVAVESAKAGGGLETMSGTSMACPHVAGAAALWWQKTLEDKGMVSAQLVSAALLASARTDVFAPDVSPADRGAGLVSCPRGERTGVEPAVPTTKGKKRSG